MPGPQPESPTVTRVTVTGMTCAHCVASVSEEIDQILGVARPAAG